MFFERTHKMTIKRRISPLTPLNISFLPVFHELHGKNEKIRVNLCKSVAKIMKNEPNLKMTIFAIIPEFVMTCSGSHPKTQNGTKPIKANFRNGNPLAFRVRPKQKIKK